jgi:Domain of unknown function (DUF4328)
MPFMGRHGIELSCFSVEPGIRSIVMSGMNGPSRAVKLPRGLGIGLLVLLGTQIVLCAAVVGALVNRIQVVEKIRSGEVLGPSEAESADTLVASVASIEAWFLIATFVVWIVWQFRAQRAARELSLVSRFRFTPGWAIGWWFVPIANLWMPFQTVRELWKASDGRPDWPDMRTWSIIGWWWGAFLGSAVTLRIASALTEEVVTADGVIRQDTWFMIALVIEVAYSVLAMAIVGAVRGRQDDAAEQRSLIRPSATARVPPPP